MPSELRGKLAAQAKAPLLQIAALLTDERAWMHQFDNALLAQGRASAQAAGLFERFILARLDGLAERMATPSARMLDVGTGTGALAAAYAETFPELRVVGIDVLPRVLEPGYDGWTCHLDQRAHNVTAKAALHGLTKAIAGEYGVHGLTANTVAPGASATQRDASQYGHIDLDAVHDRLAIKHFGAADDVGAACLYLAGEGGRFVTGQAIHVNGGEFMF